MKDNDDPWLWETRPKEERQAQSRAVDMAERAARMFGPDDDGIEDGQVAPFLSRALSVSGFERPAPKVAIDLDDEDALVELLEPGASDLLKSDYQLHGLVRDGVIHLHPKRLNKWTLLHELAHFIAPNASHGPIWCRIYVDSVSKAFGDDVGETLHSFLLEEGAKVADRSE